jgi:hypothetical protein
MPGQSVGVMTVVPDFHGPGDVVGADHVVGVPPFPLL